VLVLRFPLSLALCLQGVSSGPDDNKRNVESEISTNECNNDREWRSSNQESASDHDEKDSADHVVSTPARSRTSSGMKFI